MSRSPKISTASHFPYLLPRKLEDCTFRKFNGKVRKGELIFRKIPDEELQKLA